MTFDEIVADVMDRLNLTSDEATARIGKYVNQRFKRVVSSVGLESAVRTTTEADAVIANRYLTFGGGGEDEDSVIKLLAVYDATTTPNRVISEISFDQMRNTMPHSEPAQQYAISLMGNKSVQIFMDCTPTTTFTLTADVIANSDTLADDDEPTFAENFHDILVFGAKADELKKMEKFDLAKDAEKDYQERIADLRFFIVKSAYLDSRQGDRRRRPYTVPMV